MGDSSNVTGGAQATSAGRTNPGNTNWAAMSLTALGGLTSAYSQIQAGKANSASATANSEMAMNQATEATNAGAFAAARASIRGQQVASKALAGQAGQGVVAGAGTGGAVVQDSIQGSQMDALMIQRNAAREAIGLQTKAAEDQQEAVSDERKGDAGAISTLLNTGAQEWLEADSQYGGFRGRGIGLGGGY